MEMIHDKVKSERATAEVAGRYPGRLLYSLWTLFCMILIIVAVRDHYRAGGSSLWKPLVSEGSAGSHGISSTEAV
jgi:hypothetical protein